MFDSTLPDALTIAAPAAVAILIGGAVAALRTPVPGLLSTVQHFAAGMVFASVGIAVLPNIFRAPSPAVAVGGFALGAALTIGIKWLMLRTGRKETKAVPLRTSTLTMVGADVVICGVVAGAGLVAGARTGGLLSGALASEVLFLALLASVLSSGPDMLRRTLIFTSALLAVAFLSVTVAVVITLGGFHAGVSTFVLPFGAGALLYFVADDLVVTGRERRGMPSMAAVFCLGFFALVAIDLVA